MLHNRRSLGTRKVSPPQPTCMTDEQKATYLSNLRNNRPARPGGARPLPGSNQNAGAESEQILPRSGSTFSLVREDKDVGETNRFSMINSSSMPSIGSLKGRPLVQAPTTTLRGGENSSTMLQHAGNSQRHRMTSRERERLEAHCLREALAEIDHADDETRIFTAAQREAADLVWKHLNPALAETEKTAAYRNPDWKHRRNNTYNIASSTNHSRTNLEDSQSVRSNDLGECRIEGLQLSKRGSRVEANSQHPTTYTDRRRSSGKRNVSSGSSKGVFRNPDDQIYEEPEDIRELPATRQNRKELPLQSKAGNALLRGSRPLPEKTQSVPLPEKSKFNRFDIHRNPPSQLRNGDCTANPLSRDATPEFETPKGRAMEIRSEEIRAATSMKRKDRSPKLPTPTAVSDRPGRPIVSFDPTWRPGNESPKTSLEMDRSTSKPTPALHTTHSAPVIPTINLPDEVPSINVEPEDTAIPSISISVESSRPTINFPNDKDVRTAANQAVGFPTGGSVRPLPQINANSTSQPRPLPSHTHSSPAKLPPSGQPRNRVPWLSRGPMISGATVTCNSCQLPIAGRIVTASGSTSGGPKGRFHPECFTCFHCSTALECVSFYPEPEAAREERLQQEQDGDPAEMRFFCHLDYHDLFSPRCASCKTPIEGAVIIAAGKSWHEGHFFCAECGDPFSSASPFVEDKGYAYCVGCHTKRTSARCRGCKKQILDEVFVEALGGKWHEECFSCDDCGGDFGEDGRFFVREVEVEPTDKEKRKGFVGKKFEDRAVCHRCEELRLRRNDSFL